MGTVQLSATLQPRASLRVGRDQSETTRAELIATRWILGKHVRFFSNGEHVVSGVRMSSEQMQESEVLRFAHASLLIQRPIGEKSVLWVDATLDPVAVWIHGKRAEDFIGLAVHVCDPRLIMDANSLHEVRNEHVRNF